ncbi:helix-hairpin-helix domain-containing protein [Psychromicrobium lacuslunae]|uniref:helix-hairpin-helix domain-containing protein n=1 Tax=Psychromicrobium lacuslunae TaxID=1618207 RepID=UPI000695DF19|nr:helix-hairpin-helix domain-containing protein [Psychromicrobium lacuslunae]
MASSNKHLALSSRLAQLFPEAEVQSAVRVESLRQKIRWRVTAKAAIATVLLAAVLAVVCWLINTNTGPGDGRMQQVSVQVPSLRVGSDKVPAPNPASTVSASVSASGQTGAASFVVHIVGEVTHPGVQHVPPGSRVYQAIQAAGGALKTAALSALNLAATLQDGQQIMVPSSAQAKAASTLAAGGSSTASSGANQSVLNNSAVGVQKGSVGGLAGISGLKVNINTASVTELLTLPRVGPVLAQRIRDWHDEHGDFKKPDDLDSVPGIGSKMLEALLPLIAV